MLVHLSRRLTKIAVLFLFSRDTCFKSSLAFVFLGWISRDFFFLFYFCKGWPLRLLLKLHPSGEPWLCQRGSWSIRGLAAPSVCRPC